MFAEIVIHGIGDRIPSPIAAVVESTHGEQRQLLGSLTRKQAQQHLVERREDRGIRSDAQCQRDHRNNREYRRLPRHPESKFYVVPQIAHRFLLDGACGGPVGTPGADATRYELPFLATEVTVPRNRNRKLPYSVYDRWSPFLYVRRSVADVRTGSVERRPHLLGVIQPRHALYRRERGRLVLEQIATILIIKLFFDGPKNA